MGALISAIITKSNCYYDLDKDRHEDLVERYNIDDTTMEPQHVRVSYNPRDIWSDEPWDLAINQDLIPEWFSKEIAVWRMERARKGFYTRRVLRCVDDTLLSAGRWYIRDSDVWLTKNTIAYCYGNCRVFMTGNSTAELHDTCTAILYDNSKAHTYDNATVTLNDNAQHKHINFD